MLFVVPVCLCSTVVSRELGHSCKESFKEGFSTQARRSRGGGTFVLMYDVKIDVFGLNRKQISFFRVKIRSPSRSTSGGIIKAYWR